MSDRKLLSDYKDQDVLHMLCEFEVNCCSQLKTNNVREFYYHTINLCVLE